MAFVRNLAALALLVICATSAPVTPIEKVIELLKDLKSDVEGDGKAEADSYDKFACFCKTTTDKKSTSVKNGNDQIEKLAAAIAEKTQMKKDDITELAERTETQAKLSADLDATIERCAKEKNEYEAEAADLSKAIQGLKDALKAMKDSKPASFLALRGNLGKAIAMADVMNVAISPNHKALLALLQQKETVDPSDPEYKFHSQDIIDVCEKLLVEYRGEKSDLDDEYAKSSKACADMKQSLKKKMASNKKAMGILDMNIQKLAKEIAQHREDLVTADSTLKDDELYLKDLTARCEARAHDFDQRSAMRGAELNALTEALEVLTNDVKDRANEVNVRALLLQQRGAPTSATNPIASSNMTTVSKPSTSRGEKEEKVDVGTRSLKSISLLQELSKSSGFLARDMVSLEARKSSALAMLKQEGQRIGSMALMSLSGRAAADPFKKVKGLIQKLIERLLEESKAEATKKGFCDTELGKAESDRDFRFSEAQDLAAKLTQLQAKRLSLKEEIHTLKKDIKAESKALKETTKDRENEKSENMHTLKTAKEGLKSVNEAILILKTFYKQKATNFEFQKAALVQASPVDEDTQGAGFSGNYRGQQGSSKAIFALLETIASDFDRTIRTTEEEEHRAHRDFIDYDQAAKSSIASKETKKTLDEQDLEVTETSIETATSDMQTAVDLLDKALQELEELKPTCMDSGMSYKERVAKREEEIKALHRAMCILDEEGVEADCS